MNRRLFLTSLFATGAIAAFSDPAQARVRRRQARYSSRRYYRETTYRQPPYQQPAAYQQVRDEMPVAKTSRYRKQQPFVDRSQPEFWRSPGEIDRSIIDRLQDSNVRGLSKRQLYQQYGAPMRDEGSQMTWNIGRTSDGIIAPETFTVNLDGNEKVIDYRRL